MKIKDKAYAEHLKVLEEDRPKKFFPTLGDGVSTEEYVRQWCLKNGLKHGAMVKQGRRGKARETAPICKCGAPCQLYGGIGGYSRKCKECNEKAGVLRRTSYARNKVKK